MNVRVGKKAGCCFGVQRAIELAEKTRKDGDGAVATVGPLIHNPRKVAELRTSGVDVIENISGFSQGTIIVRSHGAGPKLFKDAERQGLQVVDATCPFVRLEQDLAVALRNEGYSVVVVGDANHAEVRAVAEWLENDAVVISPAEISTIPFERLTHRVGVVSQTTQSMEGFQRVIQALLPHCRELKVHNTICLATVQRQQEVRELAREAEVLLVIGGRDSANTQRLAEIGQEQGVATYLIESPDELREEWFDEASNVAVTAGASTPADQIAEVVHWLKERSEGREGKVEKELLKEQEEIVTETEETMEEDFAALLGAVPRRLEEGMILKALVVNVRDDGAFVNIGWKSDFIVPVEELSSSSMASAKEVVKVGDEIHVMVMRSKDQDEPFVLSKRRADQEKIWENLADSLQQGGTISGEVVRAIKGGLELNVHGLRGFLPASQVSLGFTKDLNEFVGQNLTCRVTELEPEKKRLVLSRRALLEEERRMAEEKAFAELSEGQRLKGTVTRIVPFGAFVDIGHGIEGLIHLSEMTWERTRRPEDVVSVGDTVEVVVIKLEPAAKRISLSIKALRPHPWEEAATRFHEGDIVEGTVARITDFGAFVQLAEGIDGLIHISQLAHERVKTVKDVVKEGEKIKVKILSMDPANRKIGLSLKALTPAPVVEAADHETGGTKGPSEDEEVRAYLKNQESGTFGSSLAELFEKK